MSDAAGATQYPAGSEKGPGFTVDTLLEVVMGLFVMTMMNWASEADYPLQQNMKKIVRFIRSSVFI